MIPRLNLKRGLVIGSILIAIASLGCNTRALYPSVLLTPTVTIEGREALLAGRPITVRFSWTADRLFIPPDVPYRAFVHYLDESGRLAFTDDHELPTDLRTLQAGARIEYVRRVILPDRAQRLSIRVGLFTSSFPYKANVVDGTTHRPDFPVVAEIESGVNDALSEEAVAGASGFDPWEIDGRASARSSRWVGRHGRFLFLHSTSGTTLLIQGFAMRSRLDKAQRVTVRAGGAQVVQVFENDDRVVIRIDVPGDGPTRMMEGEIESDLTFTDRGRAVSFCVERFRAVPMDRGTSNR